MSLLSEEILLILFFFHGLKPLAPSAIISLCNVSKSKPVPMVARSEVCTVFNSSNTGIVSSNPAGGMDMSEFFCVVLSCVGSGLATG